MAQPTRTLWLVRHGHREDMANPAWRHTAQRPHDPPLSTVGLQQARDMGATLAGQPIDHIVVSPFLRTLQTASLINERLGLQLKIEPGLSELLLARWFPNEPQLPAATDLADHLGPIDTTYTPVLQPSWPETEAAAAARGQRLIQLLLDQLPGNLLLITHGGIIHPLATPLLRQPPHLQTPTCCLIRLVQVDSIWQVEADGSDTSHLSCPEPAPAQA